MARFDVYKLKMGTLEYVVDIQADILSHLKTRIVVPLIPFSNHADKKFPRLTPTIKIHDRSFLFMAMSMTVVFAKDLGTPIENLESHRQDFTEAIDFLLQGF